MTAKERLMNRLAGKPVDKIPNLNIVMLFAAKYAGIPYGKFCSDYRALVEAQGKTAVDFGIDILSTMSDPYREAYDYGAKVDFVEDDLPICKTPFLTDPSDLSKLKRWNPLESTRILDRIRAIELFKQQYKEEYAILGWVEGPWAEFTDLMDINEAMMTIYDEPEFVQDAMEIITEQAIDCIKAQIDAGADIIGIGDAASSLISTALYVEFIKPLHKRMIDAVRDYGGKTKLHICGNINHLVPDMIEIAPDIIDIDYMVDFEKTIALAEGKSSICGNINPTEIILQGSVSDVRKATRYCVKHGNHTNIISGGCEVPKMTPYENLKAFDDELKSI